MTKITRKIEYALITLRHLSTQSNTDLVKVKELSDRYGAPYEVMAKVMQTLTNSGILQSEQGPHGGYRMHRQLSTLSFYELLKCIDGQVGVVKCLHGEEPDCELSLNCNIVSPLKNLNQRLIEFYQGLTVDELLSGNTGKIATLDSNLGKVGTHAN